MICFSHAADSVTIGAKEDQEMRRRCWIAIVVALVLGACMGAQAEDASVLLEKGLYLEETAGDLEKAVGVYEQIIKEDESNRRYVAEAYYRLATCQLKKGEDRKAADTLEKLLSLYPEQTVLIRSAESELAGIEPAGMVSYWPLDGDAEDHAGSHNGTVHGATLTEGISGQAYSFDGAGDYISTPDVALGAFTFSAWVTTSETGWSVNNRRMFHLDAGRNCFTVEGNSRGGVSVYITRDMELSDYGWQFSGNAWTHVAVTYDGSSVKIYINAKLSEVGECTLEEKVEGPVYIGGTTAHGGEFWHGSIDEVKLFDRALGEEEVKRLYEMTAHSAGLAGPRVASIPPEMVELLNTKVDIAFDEVPLTEVVQSLEEATPAQFALFKRDLPPDGAPVTLRYSGTLEHALDLICELAEVSWAVHRDVIKIGRRSRLERTHKPASPPIPPSSQTDRLR